MLIASQNELQFPKLNVTENTQVIMTEFLSKKVIKDIFKAEKTNYFLVEWTEKHRVYTILIKTKSFQPMFTSIKYRILKHFTIEEQYQRLC